jgi:hypothetical protein
VAYPQIHESFSLLTLDSIDGLVIYV